MAPWMPELNNNNNNIIIIIIIYIVIIIIIIFDVIDVLWVATFTPNSAKAILDNNNNNKFIYLFVIFYFVSFEGQLLVYKYVPGCASLFLQ